MQGDSYLLPPDPEGHWALTRAPHFDRSTCTALQSVRSWTGWGTLLCSPFQVTPVSWRQKGLPQSAVGTQRPCEFLDTRWSPVFLLESWNWVWPRWQVSRESLERNQRLEFQIKPLPTLLSTQLLVSSPPGKPEPLPSLPVVLRWILSLNPDSGALKEGLTLLGTGPLAQRQPWKTGIMRYIAPSTLEPWIPSLFHARTYQEREGQQV